MGEKTPGMKVNKYSQPLKHSGEQITAKKLDLVRLAGDVAPGRGGLNQRLLGFGLLLLRGGGLVNRLCLVGDVGCGLALLRG